MTARQTLGLLLTLLGFVYLSNIAGVKVAALVLILIVANNLITKTNLRQ